MSYILTVLLAGEIYRESFHGCTDEQDARITGAAMLMDELNPGETLTVLSAVPVDCGEDCCA